MNQYLLIQFLEGWTSIYIHLPAIFMFTSGTRFWPTAISTCSTWGLVARGRSAKRWISSIHLRWSSWAMSCESLGFGARWVLLRLVCPKMGCTMIYHDIPWYTSKFQSLSWVVSHNWNGRFGYAGIIPPFLGKFNQWQYEHPAECPAQRFGLAKWWAMKRTSSDLFHRFCCV